MEIAYDCSSELPFIISTVSMYDCSEQWFRSALYLQTMFKKAVQYYHDQLKNVLESFNCTMEDLGLPDDLPGFARLLQRSLVLEFLVVTVIKPIVSLKKPEALLTWHKETIRNRYYSIACLGFILSSSFGGVQATFSIHKIHQSPWIEMNSFILCIGW